MVTLTGDTHGNFDKIEEFCQEYETTKDDVMVILGDAGINYYLNSSDYVTKDKLQQLPITLFCVHGNHEERPENIRGYIEKEWHEGIVFYEKEYPNILFAKDGEIYDFNGEKAIVIGGAYSIDKQYRVSGNSQWFKSEQPDDDTKAYVEEQLAKANWKVDYVFSHTVPLSYEPREAFLPNIDQKTVDKSTEEWLDSIEQRLDYGEWFAGHYHVDWWLGNVRIIFEDFLELGE